jgi:hypothetical protein
MKFDFDEKLGHTRQEAGKLLDSFARRLQQSDSSKSYKESFDEACHSYPLVYAFYAGLGLDSGGGHSDGDVDMGPERAGDQLHKLAVERQRSANIGYVDALAEVTKEHPRLMDEYNNVSLHPKFRKRSR